MEATNGKTNPGAVAQSQNELSRARRVLNDPEVEKNNGKDAQLKNRSEGMKPEQGG